jgi:hypothetical protein
MPGRGDFLSAPRFLFAPDETELEKLVSNIVDPVRQALGA